MNKQYISILELLPALINDEDKTNEIYRGFFPSNERGDGTYYYEVEDSDTQTNKSLHFKNIQRIIEDTISNFETEFNLDTYGRQVNDDNYKTKPFILNRSYVVPHILELEFLKKSVYGDIMKGEHLDYVENILYQYLLYYNRTMQPSDANLMTHYEITSENGELYKSLSKFIFEKDDEDEDFDEYVHKTVIDNYKKLSKMKKMTKPQLLTSIRRMYACRNLEELLEISQYMSTMYDTSRTRINRVDYMSRPIPLLMLYSLLEQEIGTDRMPSYRNYNEVFENYMSELKGPMREDYTKEEYITDNNLFVYNRQLEDEQIPSPIINIYSVQLHYNHNYIEYDNGRLNKFLFPHILNQIRIVYFGTTNKIAVPQTLSRSFVSEPWADLVEPETVLSIRNLDWSEE